LRRPVPSAVVIQIAAGLYRERMRQEFAFGRIAWVHAQSDDVEVLARVLFSPGGGSSRDRRKAHRSATGMTRDAARVTFSLGLQNGFYASLEEFEIQRCPRKSWLLHQHESQHGVHCDDWHRHSSVLRRLRHYRTGKSVGMLEFLFLIYEST
jgi:hypothetical protein